MLMLRCAMHSAYVVALLVERRGGLFPSPIRSISVNFIFIILCLLLDDAAGAAFGV